MLTSGDWFGEMLLSQSSNLSGGDNPCLPQTLSLSLLFSLGKALQHMLRVK